MADTEIKILIIGNLFDNHILRLIKHLKNNTNKIHVDIYSIYYNEKSLPPESSLFKKVFILKKHFYNFLYRIKVFRPIIYLLDLLLGMRDLQNNYEAVNIHYITYFSFFLCNIFKKKCKKIVVTPWGSDIYRVKGFKKYLIKKVIKQANFITVADRIKFKSDLINIFNLSKSSNKFVNIDFGSDIIDLYLKNNSLTKNIAKRYFQLGNNAYVITCGYNANPAQNHISIINAITKIKNKLPSNTVLFFPLTYGRNNFYIEQLKNLLNEGGLKYMFFNHYLSNYEMFLLQKATDLFIHNQTTDAYSSSLQEFILSGATIINGSWLKYPSLEKYGNPYYLVDSLDSLSNVLLTAINNKLNIKPNRQLIEYLKGLGWAKMIKGWEKFYLSLNNG